MAQRILTPSELKLAPQLIAQPLASPARRLGAIFLDCLLLLLPTIAVTLIFAIMSLYISDPKGYHAMMTLISAHQEDQNTLNALIDIAPLLVRLDAPGLPSTVKVAVEKSDLIEAGQLLLPYDFDFVITITSDPPPPKPNSIQIIVEKLIPNVIRGISVFGTAVLYFTILTAAGRAGTVGKRLFGIRVVRLNNRPLSYWESFERVGGYLASIGTLGFGLLDLWRDPNRRLAHDRIANTVVTRKINK